MPNLIGSNGTILGGAGQVGQNFNQYGIGQSDAGREFIVSIAPDSGNLTQAKLDEAIAYLTTGHYTGSNTDGSSAGTIAAIGTAAGTAYNPASSDTVYVRFQTTEDFAVTDFNANDTLGVTLAVVCQFRPAK